MYRTEPSPLDGGTQPFWPGVPELLPSRTAVGLPAEADRPTTRGAVNRVVALAHFSETEVRSIRAEGGRLDTGDLVRPAHRGVA